MQSKLPEEINDKIWSDAIVFANTSNDLSPHITYRAGATEWAGWKVKYDELKAELSDYKEMHEDHKRLVKEIDNILSGDDAAQQASLCDLVGPIGDLVEAHAPLLEKYDELKARCDKMEAALEAIKYRSLVVGQPGCTYCDTQYDSMSAAAVYV